jgi:hypothetical protein
MNNNFNLLNFNSVFSSAFLTQFSLIFKVLFLIGDLFLVIFLLVVIKQVFSMDHIVHDSNDSLFIKTFGFLLLFAAISLFLISLAIL